MMSITIHTLQTHEIAINSGIFELNSRQYMNNYKGDPQRLETIKVEDFMEDQMVRKVIAFAKDLSDQIRRFKGHTLSDIAEFNADLAAQYGLVKRGRSGKGNQKYVTIDRLLMVETKINNFIEFGPEIQVAKALFDECLLHWSENVQPELQSIITNAFDTDKAGRISRTNMVSLLKVESEDPRWVQAVEALKNSMRVTGSKEYIHFSFRDSVEAPWNKIIINLASS